MYLPPAGVHSRRRISGVHPSTRIHSYKIKRIPSIPKNCFAKSNKYIDIKIVEIIKYFFPHKTSLINSKQNSKLIHGKRNFCFYFLSGAHIRVKGIKFEMFQTIISLIHLILHLFKLADVHSI